MYRNLIRRPQNLVAALLCLGFLATSAASSLQAAGTDALWFVENLGQRASDVAFHVIGASMTLDIEADGTARLQTYDDRPTTIGLEFVGASATSDANGVDVVREANVYFGDGQSDPLMGARVFSGVEIDELYEGIDLRYDGDLNRLRRRFVLEAGRSVDSLRLRYADMDVEVQPDGSLALKRDGATRSVEAKPVAFQEGPSGTLGRGASFEILPDGSVGLNVVEPDPSLALELWLVLDLTGLVDADRETQLRAQGGEAPAALRFTQVGPGQASAPGLAPSDGAGVPSAGSRSQQPDAPSAPSALLIGSDLGGGDLIPADGDVLSGSFTNVGTFHVAAGITVGVDPGVPLIVMAEEISIEGTIDADGAGFAGGATNPVVSSAGLPGSGPGGGEGGGFGSCVHGNGGGGGGYGGTGGISSSLFGNGPPPSAGGPAYGDPNPPGIMMGSGGGSAGNYCDEVFGGPGGAGGGSVTLMAQVIDISGGIEANGAPGGLLGTPTRSGGGGGSGGGIWLDGCMNLTEALLNAAGGAGAGDPAGSGFPQGGGGGAGGRVKLSGLMAPGSSHAANVAGAPAGAGDILGGQVGGAEGTSGENGSVVDLTEPNAGPCTLAAAEAVGGFGRGEIVARQPASISQGGGAGSPIQRQQLLLLLVLVSVSLMIGWQRQRRAP